MSPGEAMAWVDGWPWWVWVGVFVALCWGFYAMQSEGFIEREDRRQEERRLKALRSMRPRRDGHDE